MPRSTARLAAPSALLEQADLIARFDAIRAKAKVPDDFPPPVLAEAAQVVPEPSDADLTDIPFVTIDPAGATDLDQAMHLARRDGGYHVDYAIADVPAFVRPDGAIAAEALVRGQTIYAPDRRTPLHPPVLSEDAASLLPDQVRPAYVWRFELDEQAAVQSFDLVRATVRSRRQLDYGQVQAALDAEDPGELGELGRLLQEIGERRQALEQARGGASLPLPEQEVSEDETSAHGFTLRLRAGRPIEDWNAQLSLMTGIAAAELMLTAGVGVLRTLPPPEEQAMRRFRSQAVTLGIDWPEGESYGTFLRRLDGGRPKELALLHAAGALFRGAAYLPFDGAAPEQTQHAAVASPYAHVTAPLRRLVDRFALVAAHAAHRRQPAPDWLRAALPLLPAAMAASDRLTGEVERRCVDAVEVAVLSGRTGQEFDAVVVDADEDGDGGRVQLLDPPVLSRSSGPLTPGATVKVRLDSIDESTGTLRFTAL